MKKTFTLFFLLTGIALLAQPNRKAKMAAVFIPGYYINAKNDTIRGQVQINPDDATSFYREFAFITGKTKKPKVMFADKIKAYGFSDKHFVMIHQNGQKFFAERLTYGRLRFFEYRYNGKIDGYPAVESAYFIRDSAAEGADAGLKTPHKLSHKYYKKNLKPYMKDQPILWDDLDKYTFDKDKVVQAINEFNRFYAPTAN